VHGGSCTLNQHRKDFLLAQLEGLDHDCEQRPEFLNTHRPHCDWTCVAARASDLKIGIIGKRGADGCEVAAHPCGVQVKQQSFDLVSLRHGVILLEHGN
jgi:hypothetical protein